MAPLFDAGSGSLPAAPQKCLPDAGLSLLDTLTGSGPLERSHRMRAVRAHLLEEKGDTAGAHAEYIAAAAGTDNLRERDYLMMKAAALAPAR